MFGTYLELGFDHILDLNAYDHILFVVILCAPYASSHWRKVLALITAFTIGHSVTLALATLDFIRFDQNLIELGILLTILLTAVYNLWKPLPLAKGLWRHYVLAGIFGLIHGMGFSNYLRALLGREESVVIPLLSFNLGVELGQIIIVAITMVISYIVVNVLKSSQKWWTYGLSVLTIFITIKLLIEWYRG